MELRHLRYFVAVAEELHFTRAAERLHIGQPPLSQQIRALEEELGARLFERDKRNVSLTDAGSQFLLRSREILGAVETAKREVRRIVAGEQGVLRVGFTSSLPFTSLLPELLHDHRQAYPDVKLELREMYTNPQFDALQADNLDVGLVRFTGREPPAGIALRELRRDPLRLVVHRSHRLATRIAVDMAELRGEGFVSYPQNIGTGLANLLIELCQAAGFPAKIVQEASEATTQIGLVAAGIGIALLPSPMEIMKSPDVVYLAVNDPAAYLSLGVATRATGLTALQRNFVQLLDNYGKAAPAGAQ
ncbi:MAG: LysR family transcriptional regulator [Burkholderiales bacterium]|nr:LysR family transcriptional regulator [Burkholderiales bacterium]